MIDHCLTSSEQYFSYIQDENKFNNILKLYRNQGRDVSILSTAFGCYWKSMVNWVGTNKLVIFSALQWAYSFSQVKKKKTTTTKQQKQNKTKQNKIKNKQNKTKTKYAQRNNVCWRQIGLRQNWIPFENIKAVNKITLTNIRERIVSFWI